MKSGHTRGFTLLELMIAMTIMSLIGASIYGVVSLGARSADTGERRTEQSRRMRVATEVVVRQLRSTVPLLVRLESEDGEDIEPWFWGDESRIDFVTASPQRPDSSGLALISYWHEDGRMMMSEMPLFAAGYVDPFGPEAEELTTSVPLLYDVASVEFGYRRTPYRNDDWADSWDAGEKDSLPGAVRVVVEPETDDGPRWQHEVPLFVAVFNELSGEDDFRRRRGGKATTIQRAQGEDEEDEDEGDEDEGDEDEDDDFDY